MKVERDEILEELMRVYIDIGFRGHFNFSGFQLRLQLLPLIVVQMYQCLRENSSP